MSFSKRKLLVLGLSLFVFFVAIYNHNVFQAKPSCDSAWIRDHLRLKPNRGLNLLDRKVAFLITPLKGVGFRGWYDLCFEAEVTGRVVQVAHSTDHFFTLDVQIDELTLNGSLFWKASDGARYIRIEYETPLHIRRSDEEYKLLKQKLLNSIGGQVHARGRLLWDFDANGWLEIHPIGPDGTLAVL